MLKFCTAVSTLSGNPRALMRLLCLWNNGTVEYWKANIKMIHPLSSIEPSISNQILPNKSVPSYPLQAGDQNPLFHFSSIPAFQKGVARLFYLPALYLEGQTSTAFLGDERQNEYPPARLKASRGG
jgi:hypothetical protein